MNYEESIKYLRENSHSAYEIYKATGLSEAGLRKVLKGKITNPQRRTKEALIEYTQNILESKSDANFITDEFTLHQINLDQHDLLEDIIRRGVITERLTEIIIDNQEKLLLNSNYKNWFELQVYKKALEVMTNNKV
jgi:hypothetical protein|tara:strand:+ start:334 stop:741 length:408 start_codon:yes stop_codon:yes gene_type:complete